MRIEFIGVGEAFDETLPNNSHIVEWGKTRLLVDCGYGVPHALWKMHPEPDYLDAIYISHRHADHYFGLPSYLVRLAEDGRKRPIDVLCAADQSKVILEMIDYAYLGILPKLGLDVNFKEMTTQTPFDYRGARMEFAVSSHPVKNFAIRILVDGKMYAYSGDGNFNEHTRKLYRGCTLVIHEAYGFDEAYHGHACVTEVLKMAKEEQIEKLALTHLSREIRVPRRKEIDELMHAAGIPVTIPEPGEIYEI